MLTSFWILFVFVLLAGICIECKNSTKVNEGDILKLKCPLFHSESNDIVFFKIKSGAKVHLDTTSQQKALIDPLSLQATSKKQIQNAFNLSYQNLPQVPTLIHEKISINGDEIFIRDFKKTDEGDYGCEVKNNVMKNVIISSVEVLERARVFSFNNVTVKMGEDAIIECVVANSNSFIINSSIHPSGIPEKHLNKRMSMTKTSKNTMELKIKSTKPSDAGMYDCIASNEHSQDIKQTQLTLLYGPIISHTVFKLYSRLGHSTNFTCPFSAQPTPNVEWSMQDSKPIENNDTFMIFTSNNFTSLQITIHEKDQLWVYRKYTCLLSNPFGSTQRTFTLARASTPNAPILKSKVISATKVSLRVAPPMQDGGMPVIGYTLYQSDQFLKDFNKSGVVSIDNLEPNALYYFSVRARNQVGPGEILSFHVKTPRIAIPEIEMQEQYAPLQAFHHTIAWKVISDGGMPINNYQIFVRQITPHSTSIKQHASTQQIPDHTWNKFETTGFNETYTLEDLSAGAAYEVVMRARNQVGWSSFTPAFFFTTRYATPDELQNNFTQQFSFLLMILIFLLIILLAIIFVVALICRHRWMPGCHSNNAMDKQSFGRRSHCSTNSSRPSNNTTPIPTHNSHTTLLLRHSNSATPNQRSNASTPTSTLLSTTNNTSQSTPHHPNSSIPPQLPPRNPPSRNPSPHHKSSHQAFPPPVPNPRHSNSHHHKIQQHLNNNHSSSLPLHHRSRSPHNKSNVLLSAKLPTSSSHQSSPIHHQVNQNFRISPSSFKNSPNPKPSSKTRNSFIKFSPNSSPSPSVPINSPQQHGLKRISAKNTSLPPVPVDK